jgi:N-acetylglucosamine kinase-like BadF-type ATPase
MITITKRGWRHILKHHTGKQPPKHAKKSRFHDTEDLIQLLNEASQCQPIGTFRKHLVRTFDAGHEVGINITDGKATTIVTVLTRLNGDLVTMFPGSI